jgi:hypothetical protein
MAPVTLPGEWFAVWPIEFGTLYWSKPSDHIWDYPMVPEECFEVAEATLPITMKMLQDAYAQATFPL